ncbi:MAG: PPA1309 family protein [Pseudonocardiales bacterium]
MTQPVFLESVTAEIEAHVGGSGWDRPPVLFALVRAAQFAADEPDTAAKLGLSEDAGDALTPIEQEDLPDGPLDETLAQIAWPDSVAGCALSQQIVMLPPAAQAQLTEVDAATAAARHPDRREARLVVAVLRDGSSAAVLRLRGANGADEALLTGADLAPNLAGALLATLE